MNYPTVSLIMLACDKASTTEKTLEALLQTKYPADLEFILVNNGSTDHTITVFDSFAAAAKQQNWTVKLIDNPKNVGAIAGRNQALLQSTGDAIVFLDNDVIIGRRSWLTILTQELADTDCAGILSPKILFGHPPHLIQCAGCVVGIGGRVAFRGRGDQRESEQWSKAEEVQALISACWIMSRQVYTTLGDLDMLFHPVQFEDIDYCYRARQAGFRVGYTPALEVYHFENTTTANTSSIAYRGLTIRNGVKFKHKWGKICALENGPDDASLEWRDLPHVSSDTTNLISIID